jgi:E3 ubiquitin-protein ligase DOA10
MVFHTFATQIVRKRSTHIVLTIALAILFFFGAAPKEFFHSFAHHKDTEHLVNYGKGKHTVDAQHHHCDYLDFVFTPFLTVAYSISFPVVTSHVYLYIQYCIVSVYAIYSVAYFLRGPPAFGLFSK